MSQVLVVDDEYTIRDFLCLVLEEEGYQVSSASNGGEAMDMLAAATPDLVLLDVMMPVLDGREVLRRMRADPALRGVPVLVMSAAATAAMLGTEANGFLRKPFELTELIGHVANIVNRGASSGTYAAGGT
jgi:CheY-like chemotaxis protein